MAAEDEGEDEELLRATFGVIILSESGVQLSLVKNKGYRDEISYEMRSALSLLTCFEGIFDDVEMFGLRGWRMFSSWPG